MDEKKISETKLLYDPLFDKAPDTTLPDDPSKGLWGKTKVKKIVFAVFLIVSIGFSVFWSFRTVSSDLFRYEEKNGTYQLHSFRGDADDKVLCVDYVRNEKNVPDKSKVVTSVREFSISCNDYVEYIFISKNVTELQSTCFYSCNGLKAIIADPENPNFASVDGVLYKKDNGKLTEILYYPVCNGYYRVALQLGIKAPESDADIEAFNTACEEKRDAIYEEYLKTGTSYVIPDGVELIGVLCFNSCHKTEWTENGDKLVFALENITIPGSVKRIETMAFFKCRGLKEIYISDNVEYIGSDAFTECKALTYLFIPASVKEIGHHAFNKCEGLTQVFMGHESKKDLKLGTQWYPQVSKTLMVSAEILFGQQRNTVEKGENVNG